MTVAEQFGKTEIISDLHIHPTAAYLLSAQSTPDEARQIAFERAQSGEQITAKVAREILANVRKRRRGTTEQSHPESLDVQLISALENFKDRWDSKDLTGFARHLREFADELESDKTC